MLRNELSALFGCARPLIGMVHLLPLPGSPRFAGQMGEVIDAAIRDAQALEDGGAAGVMVENFGDVPFYPDRVPAETIAAMAAIIQQLSGMIRVPIGVNVLRNDGATAIAIAAATGAKFVRVNVLTGTAVTDQGLISSTAHEVLRTRRALAPSVKIFADLRVKHASSLSTIPLAQEANELFERALADALICSGATTGAAVDIAQLQVLREIFPQAGLIAGSGTSLENVEQVFGYADAVIVGTALKFNGTVENRVDPARVQKLVERINTMG